MKLVSRLVVAAAAVLAACASEAQDPARGFPVSKMVIGGNPPPLVAIDPASRDQRWNLRSDFRSVPLALHNERTVRVIEATSNAYMDRPLCTANPTMYASLGHERWGRILYDNLNGERSRLLLEVRTLVEANCPPNTVKAINVAVFVRTLIHGAENARYLDSYEAKYDGLQAGRFVYYGIVVPGNEYALVHHDANGLERYLKFNRQAEARAHRLGVAQAAQERLRKEGLGAIFTDYCAAQPAACAGLAVMILSGGGGARSGSGNFQSCMAACQLRAPTEQAFCQSSCYEHIAR